jgi:hypothetical protein
VTLTFGRTGRPQAGTQTGFFERRDILKELVRLAGGEDLWLINPLRLHEPAHKFALRRGPLHRGKQRKESLAVPGSGKLVERTAEREILRRRLVGDPVGVSGEKGERMRPALLVLRQVERHPPDKIPNRVLLFQPPLRSLLRTPDAGKNEIVELSPKAVQPCAIQVFRPGHRGRGGSDFFKLGRTRRRYLPENQRVIRVAKRSEIPACKRSPETLHRRHRHVHMPGRQVQQQCRRTFLRRGSQAVGNARIQIRCPCRIKMQNAFGREENCHFSQASIPRGRTHHQTCQATPLTLRPVPFAAPLVTESSPTI